MLVHFLQKKGIANSEWRIGRKGPPFAIRCSLFATSEHAEMLRDDGVVELDAIGGAAKHHAAGIDDDNIVGEVERKLDVLLDQHDRLPLGLELRDGAADLGHELRREP